ncbi:DNA-directed RNA polymerase subunit beta' [Candidatus Nomurabacteria bacterium RIFCSPHIGHO2_01_FULL_37_25]|uniref:DNA-directed RNA polymerase subunit beta' n=1 Tax=Candidatus Nomurabacteria bacterium RIFCSPLOWO2_01_FULL_36_16 TaxID=1801767 RepID=A0A1F6X0C9_9BACT|nr:MAG: DNA-directed RNA polymerase subunit beta' [Candidatus Nomurabacteria bacterium RIFCSPHIGHO2_01_FULL_37_25]OGI75080.1 MAG: DNA-directed RNA polymerase subunit beta' [Candidatus Nomurabacteria bacterium RIFCSPHIGHO2_02_FULL_36_29]OGI87591.1 MAG: DNA-directed RNA polymerase subunit beta' [Candidatus Nomurabacteria bacterium RIFCSPLOWO2_01_FULL_36_16]
MKTLNTTEFDSIALRLASPEQVKEWSFGEVTKPETINYRTGRSERGGLFDEKIFGPEKDYECYCGKYRRIRYKDIICEKCGVEVTRSIVRRERMGHIELGTPVSHIWFLRGVPSRMSILLNISVSDLEKVIYFAGYIITKVHEEEKESVITGLEKEYKVKLKNAVDDDTREKLKNLLSVIKKEIGEIYEGKVLNEISFHHYSLKYGTCFEANIGAEAIYSIFKNLDLNKLKVYTEKMIEGVSMIEKEKLQKRLSLIRAMTYAGIRPEWMFLTVIPVIPPVLRPMVALDGGRHATSDLNDLYRRVINRNNRLKKLKEINAPDVILRNEKRIIQEAVDALIDNSIAKQNDSAAMSQSQKRPLKSLSDNLKSKQGLFRQNLLGKRVDYSGRSVIVVGPNLKLNQCGLPKHMALELFRPFVISKILQAELAFNIRGANKLIEERTPEVWAMLEEVIAGKYVLLNRAPTLHRLGIQAFNPILIEGNAIQIHPLVCQAFNADFDGDQMAVYVPLLEEAQSEAKELMASNKNLLKPQNGDAIVHPRMDMVLGSYWMTKSMDGEKGEDKYFSRPNVAISAYEYGIISLRAKIKVLARDDFKYKKFAPGIFETSVGKLLFNSILPDDFSYVNDEMTQDRLSALLDELIIHSGVENIPAILDKIKAFGFKYATVSGTTWGLDNVSMSPEKPKIIAQGKKLEEETISQWREGLLSEEEKYQKIIEIWTHTKKELEKVLPKTLDKKSSTYDLFTSKARGTMSSLMQMTGMIGLIQNNQGKTLEFPIIPSYQEGLSPIEYFVITHGARKGASDTALNTAKAGYLTRRLVDVAQDVVITEKDCGTKEGKIITRENISGIEIPLSKNIHGRILGTDLKDKNGKVLYKKGFLVTKEEAHNIEGAGFTEVFVRSPLTCRTVHGLCQMCYGLDLGRNRLVDLGEAVGIIAAQAIGEPGTQLTLRTFHAGGVAGTDITTGLPRVEEIFERRIPKNPAVISETDGEVISISTKEDKSANSQDHSLSGGEKIIKVLSDVKLDGKNDNKKNEIEYVVAFRRIPTVKVGDKIKKGDLLTDGSADVAEIFKFGGKELVEEYLIREINKVYELQSASISRKHTEIIIRQMFSRRKIKDAGETNFSIGNIVENAEFIEENARVPEGKQAKAEIVVLGITEVSLRTKSWLSAASFQNTNRVLIENAIKGGVDSLRGLKENVIIGRLIPAGTGFKNKTKTMAEK